MYPFDRAPEGQLVVTFYEGHQVLLTMLLTEVRALIEAPDADNRVSDRLFPVAYLDPTEDVAETEWQALVHDDLVRDKLVAFDDIRTLLAEGRPGPDGTIVFVLDAEQEEHLLGALNDLRLVLAELIDGDDDSPGDDAGAVDTGAVGAGTIGTGDLLEWLTALVSELIEVKLAGFAPD
jgi:hypothetical protein